MCQLKVDLVGEGNSLNVFNHLSNFVSCIQQASSVGPYNQVDPDLWLF